MNRSPKPNPARGLDRSGARVASLVTLVLALPWMAGAQQTEYPAGARTAPLDAEMPWAPELTVGELDNGLRYYVRENDEPENRAELRLVVNVGSVLEDPDQLGLAHFVEHMAFNGTENFAKQELVEFMESIGMGFGADLNAYTGFDETVYMLRVPTDDEEILGTSFQVLEDWAHRLVFEPEEVDKERGVVIEEWRLRQGAGSRVQEQQIPVLFGDSRYAERLPIGEVEILESFDREALVRFYEDWYRPELMAVIAVGDFDGAAIEERIRDRFSGLENPDDPRPREVFDVPGNEEPIYETITDPELTNTSVAVYHKLTPQSSGTVGDYRDSIVEQLYNGMLNNRFRELAQRPDPPFLGASSRYSQLVRGQAVYVLGANVADGGIERGLESMFTEAARVERHGFTAAELEREKTDALRFIERLNDERTNRNSRSYASEYIRNFLEGESVPGIPYEYELYQRFVPEVSLEEVNAVGRRWITDDNRIVMITAPEKTADTLPDEATLDGVIAAVETAQIEPWVDSLGDADGLMATLPAPGSIVEERQLPAIGVTEWTLSNGAEVILKPTDFREDQILFSGFSPGGTSLAPTEMIIPAQTAAQVVAQGGLGDYSSIDLQKLLTGKAASASPSISTYEEGISGQASPKDLETLFQLAHMRFTAPRKDPQIFQVMTQQMRAFLANQEASPQFAFARRLNEIMNQGHPRAPMVTAEMIDRFDLDASFDFYRERFADAGDFTFVFVGSFDPATMRPLVERYLASLPATGRQESWRDPGIEPPDGVVTDTVVKGLEPRAQTQMIFTGEFPYDDTAQRRAIDVMSEVLQIQLRNLLREDLGGTYGVQVSANLDWRPEGEYSLTIRFASDPERLDELTDAVFAEIREMQEQGPPPDDVEDVKERRRRSYETNLEQNGFWRSILASAARRGVDPTTILDYVDTIDAVTPEAVQQAAARYFDFERYVQLSLLPEPQQDGTVSWWIPEAPPAPYRPSR